MVPSILLPILPRKTDLPRVLTPIVTLPKWATQPRVPSLSRLAILPSAATPQREYFLARVTNLHK